MPGKKALWITIQEVANKARVPQATIRHYTEVGLLTRRQLHPEDKIHHYPPDTVERVRTIRRLRKNAFTVPEIQIYLTCQDPKEKGQMLETVRRRQMHRLTLLLGELLGLEIQLEQLKEQE
ncbi:helix-turn-helix domain-containing protein [Deinococcus roseus]|uniref:HTH merR-type domain-containing protein n=1 Tax=Deinococcus roseus TaxID=392414 RepID=A0ABQ2DEJ1_9DEIO|nr:helix-turn-helix domain-containing protein [Deinococcus roseus]GGJ55216.1 hypothetical protein GCM10008938_46700 [Deinococcus roseus]